MKKLLFISLILMQQLTLWSQTLLATAPLELKKAKDYRQILNAENTKTHELFGFATDKEALSILRFNSALFLTNRYSFARPADYKTVAGYSFHADGNPTLYWSTPDYKTIKAIQYDLASQTEVAQVYEQQFFNQTVLMQFQANDSFYLLARKHFEQKLVLYTFKDGKKDEKAIDFGSFKFKNSKSQEITFTQILDVCPIEKIETTQFNPLFKGSQRTKLYALKNKLLLSFDHNDNETQAFEIDLSNFQIQEKIYPKIDLGNIVYLSNSYYHEGKIYQLKVNAEKLYFDIKDYESAAPIKSLEANLNENIPFKTSPLLLQLEGQRPKEISSTRKFLQQLSYLDVGLTVYKTPKAILITIGGTGNIQFTDVASIYSGADPNIGQMMYQYIPTTAYFESVFDKKLENNKPEKQDPLAVDFISGFIQEHKEASLFSVIRYSNYYIMAYYDSDTKEFKLRKFTDGLER